MPHERADRGHDLVDERPQLDAAQLDRRALDLAFADVEHLRQQAEEVLAGLADVPDERLAGGVAPVEALAQRVAAGDDRPERLAICVADGRQEAALGPIGLDGLVTGLLELPIQLT